MRLFGSLAFLALFGVPVLSMGCEAVVSVSDNARNTVYKTDMPDAGQDSQASGADSPMVPPPEGGGAGPSSPLCAACPTDVLPDDNITAKQCGLAPDGGAYDAKGGYDNASLACRVAHASSANQTQVTAACSLVGEGGDGALCSTGSDCQSGLECVADGTCRHYCCRGDVSCKLDEFCDVQPIKSAESTKVPVCMMIQQPGCTLLDDSGTYPNACPQTPVQTTCAVVRADGTTGCVEIGSAKAGESCEIDHCARDLVCLGFGATMRQCYQLCNTGNGPNYGQCPGNTTCQAKLPLFQNPSVGICQQ